jgi:hypothetical protein
VRLLTEVQAVGVWGNHDLGLCDRPTAAVRRKYPGPILDYLQTLRPRLELEGCLFTHGLPSWDAADPVVYYLGERPETPEGLARSFSAVPHRLIFLGHFHRWLLGTAEGIDPWRGERPLSLAGTDRYLVVVHAVSQGRCALFDTEAGLLTPLGQD